MAGLLQDLVQSECFTVGLWWRVSCRVGQKPTVTMMGWPACSMIMSVAFLLRAAFVHSPMPLAFLRSHVLKHMVSQFDQSEESINVTQLYQCPLASLRHSALWGMETSNQP